MNHRFYILRLSQRIRKLSDRCCSRPVIVVENDDAPPLVPEEPCPGKGARPFPSPAWPCVDLRRRASAAGRRSIAELPGAAARPDGRIRDRATVVQDEASTVAGRRKGMDRGSGTPRVAGAHPAHDPRPRMGHPASWDAALGCRARRGLIEKRARIDYSALRPGTGSMSGQQDHDPMPATAKKEGPPVERTTPSSPISSINAGPPVEPEFEERPHVGNNPTVSQMFVNPYRLRVE